MNNIKGNRYIYHYHVFENVVENFGNYDLSEIIEVLPVVAFGTFKRNSEVNFGKITENHQLFQKQKFYKEILKYVGQNYLKSEGYYNNYISMDSYSSYHTYFLAPIVFEIENKTIYTYFTLKIFNQGIFYVEISDELDKLKIMEDNFNIVGTAKRGYKVLIPQLTEGEIDYKEIEIKENIINNFISDYWKEIVENIEKIFNQGTKHSYYTLFMIDNSMHSISSNINDYKKIVTAPYYNELGSYFIKAVNQFTFSHFTFIGNIDRMVINLNSGKNEYGIPKEVYTNDKTHFRGINNAFIMSALNHIYIKKTILNLLAETTYTDTPLHKEWLNKLEKTIIQGYSLKYLPSHTLRSELDKNFIDDKEFEFIQKVHFENSNNIINKQQKVMESKINFLNIIILIFTIISLGQIVDIFINDKLAIVSIIIGVGITISVIYIKYLNWLKKTMK
ncbi:hypothetical protein [Staphylococcus schweitzeri]|uniref:hypothetical protein n=1 Tax=Staphylococcus schweitzeri TaxID=1654388 RepID=UPI0005062F3A|nr:hypothetical protein [Staphylococcus schweitzeri]CDR52651.1 hypothetical protein ERS140159_02648 [Staphylococcus schweitzeri]